MKVAVFMTGHFRDAPKTRENYKQFLKSGNETDFYVGTWSNYDVHREEWKIIPDRVNVEETSRDIFGDQLKGLWIGDAQKYENGELPHPNSPKRTLWADYCSAELLEASKNSPHFHPGDYPNLNYYFYWTQRLLDQYYVMRETYRLASNFDDYDVCIRIRSDMRFVEKPPVPIYELADGVHVNGYVWQQTGTHDYTNLQPWGISDQLAWGQPKWMRKYFEYANHYCEMLAPLIKIESCAPRWNGTTYPPEIHNAFYCDANHQLAYYLLRYPYFRNLDPNDINDHDIALHRHGHAHTDVRTPAGVVISYDYYDIISKWRYG